MEEAKYDYAKKGIRMPEINQDYMVDGTAGSEYINHKYNLENFRRKLYKIDMIIVHCTASGGQGWESPEAEIRYATNPNHISKRGCATASYHFYVNQKGKIWQLVSMNYYTWNCSGQNPNSIAICINHDGFKQSQITNELYNSLVDTICYVADFMDWSYDEYGVRDWLHFHRDFANKACPGMLNYDELVKSVSERLKVWGDNV
jgi:hypothetical protein